MGGSAGAMKRHEPDWLLVFQGMAEMASWSLNVCIILRAVREGRALRVGVVRRFVAKLKYLLHEGLG